MFRAAIELLFTITIILVARAVLTSLLRGFTQSVHQAGAAGRPANAPPSEPPPSGELHKDPVCGTYVTESTRFRRQAGRQTFYYCSEACREKHALVAY